MALLSKTHQHITMLGIVEDVRKSLLGKVPAPIGGEKQRRAYANKGYGHLSG